MQSPDVPAMTSFSRLSLGDLPFDLPQAIALPFDIHDPSHADFGRHGITCPPSVARSVTKRQVEFLAGRRCALQALRERQCLVTDLPIGPDRAPLWPEGLLGSITHVDGLAAAVATGARGLRGIGIDIERIPNQGGLDALRSTVLVAGEHRAIDELADAMGQPMALTLAFSAKESFYKAAAKAAGRMFDFDAVEVLGMASSGLLDLVVAVDLSADLPRGTLMQVSVTHLDERTLMTACAW